MTIKLGYSPSATLKLVEGISPQEKRRTKSCKPIFIGPLYLKTTLIFAKLVLGANNWGGGGGGGGHKKEHDASDSYFNH